MSGSKFSTSRGKVIYVGDFLREFGPDALRYFIAVAGPENHRHRLHLGRVRPPDQLRAGQRVGQPGQPLALDGAQEHRRHPAARDLRDDRPRAAGRPHGQAFDTVGALLRAQPVQAGHRRGDAGGRRGQQVPLRHRAVEADGDPARRDTVLHTALQVVSDANTLLTPFLPHAAQKVHEALGGTGVWAAQPEIRRSARRAARTTR